MKNVIGLVNFHTAPEVLPITASRPLGSTSYLGRYAFCDFALSNLCNSGISQVGLLVKDHQRSILKHLGNMSSWVINTKIGHQRILYNEPAHRDPRLNTDLNNLVENDWLLYDSSAEYLLFVPSHLVVSMDLRPYLKNHVAENRAITLVASKQRNVKSAFLGSKVLEFDAQGTLVDANTNAGQYPGPASVYLDTLIVNRHLLIELIQKYKAVNPLLDIFSLLLMGYKDGVAPIAVEYFDGFVRSPDTFHHYMDYSLEMLDKHKADQLFNPQWPIYTLTHDTPPALYGVDAEVSNSYVSNGARVQGKVFNSIIARNVIVGKGAIVKNSIIFSSVKINDGAVVENALIDKYAIIEREHTIKGKAKDPLYVAQGAIL
ncbi:MAG: hypothetical protein J6A47_04650 [Bacilli bacterium]|nr:hypothetical protein [Bacilli bacterium]